MRISDWSSDVCSSDLRLAPGRPGRDYRLGAASASRRALALGLGLALGPTRDRGTAIQHPNGEFALVAVEVIDNGRDRQLVPGGVGWQRAGRTAQPVERSEEHTSELQSLMRNSYAVFCLKK